MNQRTIYLDHSATTPVDPRVVEAMLPYWTEDYGNPSSIHHYGRQARAGLEQARRTIADILNCKPGEIIFTGCGSESDNLALRGVMHAAAQQPNKGTGDAPPHLVTSIIEHEAVLATAEQLRDLFNFSLTVVGVDRFGRVDPDEVAAAIRPETALISIMAANNEIGTVQPIEAIGQLARERGVLFHSDAIQAAGFAPFDVQAQPIDLLSLAPHKFYGPKGIGILYVRDGIPLESMLTGGGQENGRRAGTSNVPLAVGAARALALAQAAVDTATTHCQTLRDRLIEGLSAAISPDEMVLTGHPQERLHHHASFAFKHLSGNDILMQLDAAGIAASSGSACASGNPRPSPILAALGLPVGWTTGGLRLTVGRGTTPAEIEHALQVIPEAIARVSRFTAAFTP